MEPITGYHAHIYFDPAQRRQAIDLRQEIGCRFSATVGRVHDQPVGPHPKAMYQVAFAPPVYSELVPWLMLNRDGLTVLVHPETGDDLVDHRDYALWMGELLALDLSALTSGFTESSKQSNKPSPRTDRNIQT